MPRAPITDPAIAALGRPGPHRVAEYDMTWVDATRQRRLAVHIYAPDPMPASAPVIIFSHGLGNSRHGYRYLGEHWASHGYVSVHPGHPDLNETALKRRGWWWLFRKGFDRKNWIDIPKDLSFVIDQLEKDDALPRALRGHIDRSAIGVAGHSLGAYGALALSGLRVLFPDGSVMNFRDPRVRAAVEISMSENFQPASYTDIAIPILHITGTRDWDLLYATWARKRRVPYNSIHRDDQYLVVVRGANHSTFSDDEPVAVKVATLLFWDSYLRKDATALAEMRGGRMARGLAPLARVSVKPPPTTRIGAIHVRAAPLFDPAEASRGGFYQKANLIAVPTPEKLLRKFLLFREGDPYDPQRLAETERTLRTLTFLKTASVTAGEPHDGVVDVTIATQDALTTDIQADFSNDGGRSLYDLVVQQKDLFGSGSEVDVETASGRERRVHSIQLLDPVIFGHYWNAGALVAKNSDGNEERFTVSHPLFSHATHFTTDVLADHLLQNARTYAGGAIATEFRQQHRGLSFTGGLAVGTGPWRNTRLLAGIDFLSDDFGALRGLAPDDRNFKFVQVGFDRTDFRFVKLDHVDFGMREQDYNLGVHSALSVGRTPANVWRLRGDQSIGYSFGPRAFVVARLAATTRARSAHRNAIVSNDDVFVARWATAHPLAFVSRVRVDSGSDLDRDLQFFADGQNGLRSYPNYAFEGRRRVLLNLEQRMFLGRELLQLVEPGAAIFVDTGEAGESLALRRLRTDFGAGLRLAISRLDQAIIRLDVGYALNDSPTSKRGLVVSVATSQAF
jgi:predicted dienelactone hydrolase